MFAGPNGSGKSTLKEYLRPDLLGYYVNADEIESALRSPDGFDFRAFALQPLQEELREFFANSTLLQRVGLVPSALKLRLDGTILSFGAVKGNSYYAAVVADYVRRQLLARGESFAFETVMSSRDKVALLREARHQGYRTYLYYVATEDAQINVSRVRNRVLQGGHDVPADKIVSRYDRSLDLLAEAIYYSSRAYLFDNSGENVDRVWIAEFTDGSEMEPKTKRLPQWFVKAVLDKLVTG